MLIERICPDLAPALRQSFAMPFKVDDAVHALVVYGDCAFLLGALFVIPIAFTASLGLDVVRFVIRQRKYWGKHGT